MTEQFLLKYAPGAERTAFLLQLVKEHPYFTPAQFWLLQQTAPEDPAYAQRAAITSMLFGNPGWLNFQLNNGFGAHTVVPAEELQAAATEAPAQPDVPAATGNTTDTTLSETALPGTEAITATAPAAADEEAEISAAGMPNSDPLPETPSIPGPKPHQPADGDLLFEPLYAVDYFASQGIKLSDEVQPGDKLGRQLKSFTEWLKSMKKTHPTEAADADEGTAGTVIQQIAEKSNAEDAVITEAMADVYVLQGNHKKAIATYRKLSLLNPSKSAYFAAKIENLK